MQTDLYELFQQILTRLRQMHQLLEQEALNLKGRDADALEKTTQQKERLASELDALAKRQEAILLANHLPPGKPGLDSILCLPQATDPGINGIRQTWQDIQDLTDTCQRLNEVNGAYIGLLRQHVQRSVDIIHGQSSQHVVYGRDGIGHRPTSSRKLLSV